MRAHKHKYHTDKKHANTIMTSQTTYKTMENVCTQTQTSKQTHRHKDIQSQK